MNEKESRDFDRLKALNAYRFAHLELIALVARKSGYRSAVAHALAIQKATGEFIEAAVIWDAYYETTT